MKKLISLIVLLCFIVMPGFADETEGKTELGIKAGASSYWGDINDRQANGTAAVSLFWWISDPFAIGFNAGASFLQAEESNRYFKTMLYNFTPSMKIKLFPSSPLNPYLTAGFEIMHINPQNKAGNKLPNIQAGEYKNIQFAIPFGGGFSIFFSEVVGLELEALYHQGLADWIDDTKAGDNLDGYFTGTLGLVFNLGAPRDSDNDGIPDKYDGDPARAEDFDGFEDADGIPDPDNDQDGVPDYSDQARNDPEDHDGFQDQDGAPDPDNDGDGILDVNDKCPNEAEDIDGVEDEDGCPEIAGKSGLDGNIVLMCDDIFTENSEMIKIEGKEYLDDVITELQKFPNKKWRIEGHMDSNGNKRFLRTLSLERAKAVLEYLTYFGGLNREDFQVFGMGDNFPIDSNDTEEGRSKNRRIEIIAE